MATKRIERADIVAPNAIKSVTEETKILIAELEKLLKVQKEMVKTNAFKNSKDVKKFNDDLTVAKSTTKALEAAQKKLKKLKKKRKKEAKHARRRLIASMMIQRWVRGRWLIDDAKQILFQLRLQKTADDTAANSITLATHELQDEYDEMLRSVSSLLASNAADKEKYDILRQQKRLKEKSLEANKSAPDMAQSLETVKGNSGTSIFSIWVVLLFSLLSFVLGQYLSTTIATE